MTRLTPRLLLMGALLSPATLYALGLGEIRLNSALNQPLDAEIELIAPTQEELTSLKVNLANVETFQRYGLDRPQFLSGLRFEVTRGKQGGSVIKVSSNRSITEPFVTLLVEASWARGRLLREYTVLLDPPVFMPGEKEAPAVVQAPRSGASSEGRIERESPAQSEAAPAPEPAPAAPTPVPQPRSQQPAPAPAAAAEAPSPEVAPGSTYTVQRNDTLYRIAQEVRPGPRRVINQTMIALYRANPDAFAGTIHRLKAGSVLRVPETSAIEATDAAEASSEVARQTEAWRAGTDAGHLQLVTPSETPSEKAAQTPTAPATSAPAAPGAQPSTSKQPSAPASSAPATESKRPVTIPDAGLSQMQERLGEEQKAPAPSAEAPAPSEAPAATTEAQPETPAAQPEPPKPVAKPAPAPAPEGGLLDTLKDYWWAVLGLLALLAAAAFVVRRRQAQADEDTFPTVDYDAPRSAPSISPPRDIPDRFLDDEPDEPAPVVAPVSRAPVVEAPVAARSPEDTLSSETAVQLDQQDALAEADFHMAYGLYDQAADLVKIAIEREPGRRDLQLKLLEIYFVWGNKDLFLETARGLHATRAQAVPGEWEKVSIMGRQIAPEDAMFQADGTTHVDAVDVNLEGGENRVDIDLFGEPEAEQGKDLDIEFGSGERATVKTQGDSSLDFLLDEPTRGADDEPTREMDPLARTQETPTIESPALDRGTQTVRAPSATKASFNTEQTAELSLDDLGLDVNEMENTNSFEETSALEDVSTREMEQPAGLRDDEMTQLAPSMSNLDRTMEAPRPPQFDIEATGTISIDNFDFEAAAAAAHGDTIEQRKPSDLDATAAFSRPPVDMDLDNLDGLVEDDGETVRRQGHEETEADRFSNDVFNFNDSRDEKIDLDVGDAFNVDDSGPTNTQAMTAEMDLGEELEPVTMSEVGTKLDLARAYMDMGDPDGARSILEEVLEEGNPNQKQEAQRLLEAVK
ncbi:MAG: FimV/HubP family polar landmark protein [Steroidobacteraceae bacterium]